MSNSVMSGNPCGGRSCSLPACGGILGKAAGERSGEKLQLAGLFWCCLS